MAKRTYSQRGRPPNTLAQELLRKRSKLYGNDNELSWPPPTGTRPQKPSSSSSSSSSSLRNVKFSGPVSLPDDDDDDMDTNEEDSSKSKTSSMFDKALKGKLKSVTRKQPNIHGSREDFDKTMVDPKRAKKSNAGAAGKYLPTPPSDVENQHAKKFDMMFPGLKCRGLSVLGGDGFGGRGGQSKSGFGRPKESDKSKFFDTVLKEEEPKRLYVRKQYEAENVSVPRRDICGNRLSSKSELAKIWSTNQTTSPFLRLPNEVRARIYDLAFSNKTILIEYQTYTKKTLHTPARPVFKYTSTIIAAKTDPFNENALKRFPVTNALTLLSNTCRQLYIETAALPFVGNHIAFDSHNTMVSYVVHEKRLSRQQRSAITTLVLPDDVPGGNVLGYLPNVERVWLAFAQYGKARGWYRVVRGEGGMVGLKVE